MNIVNDALNYARQGFSVIPVGKNKIPLIDWKRYQMERASESQIKEWFEKKFTNANIGIVTGKISNLIVVDIEKGGSVQGLPITKIVKTGGGGWHYYYLYSIEVGNRTRIRDLVDIRGEGGYVVAPPSTHLSGQQYVWANSEEKMVSFPVELLGEDIQRSKIRNWQSILGGVSKGARNMKAASLFGKLLPAFKQSEWEMVWQIGVQWNKKNIPPMDERELRLVYESISKKESIRRSGNEKTKNNFEAISFKDLMEKDLGEIQWLVERLVPQSGITIISGKPKSMKTWVLLEIALKSAAGEKVFGEFPTKKTGILIIDEENGERLLKERLEMMSDEKDLPIFFASQKEFCTSSDSVNTLLNYCEKNEIGAVFFDPFVRVHSADENSSREISEVFKYLRRLPNNDIAVILVHHNRKSGAGNQSGDQMRGSSDIFAAINSQLSVERDGNKLKIEQTKSKESEEIEQFEVDMVKLDEKLIFAYQGVPNVYGKKSEKAEEIAVNILREYKDGLSRSAIVSKVKEKKSIGDKSIRSALERLKEEGRIFEKPGKGNERICFLSENKPDENTKDLEKNRIGELAPVYNDANLPVQNIRD